MSILDVQKRNRSLGRIRYGAKHDKGYPITLEKPRFTSPSRRYVEAAAELYGGDVQEWTSPKGKEWEVYTDVTELECIVPLQRLEERQVYELYDRSEQGKAVERLRICDGVTQRNGEPCVCDPNDRACKPSTWLGVMLPYLPGTGLWVVKTGSYNAAAELPSVMETAERFAALGKPQWMVLSTREERSVKDGQVKRFRVVQLDFRDPIADILQSLPEGEGVRALMGGSGRSGPGGSPLPSSLPAGAPSLPDSSVTPITEAPSVRGSSETASDAVSPAESIAVHTWGVTQEGEVIETHEYAADVQPPTPADIETLLRSLPDKSDTMAVWETYVRHLFRIMEHAGHWLAVNSNGQDSLHAALDKLHGVPHLGDLRKAELVAFTQRAHAAAAAKLGAE